MKIPIRRNIPILSMRLFEPTRSMPSSCSPTLSSTCLKSPLSFSSPISSFNISQISSFGMKSIKASDFSSFRKVRVMGGNEIFQIRIQIKNWSRFMMFQRYLRPNEEMIYSRKMKMQISFITYSKVSLNSSIYSFQVRSI